MILVGVNPDTPAEGVAQFAEATADQFEIGHFIVSLDSEIEIRNTIRSIIAATYLHHSQGRRIGIYDNEPML